MYGRAASEKVATIDFPESSVPQSSDWGFCHELKIRLNKNLSPKTFSTREIGDSAANSNPTKQEFVPQLVWEIEKEFVPQIVWEVPQSRLGILPPIQIRLNKNLSPKSYGK